MSFKAPQPRKSGLCAECDLNQQFPSKVATKSQQRKWIHLHFFLTANKKCTVCWLPKKPRYFISCHANMVAIIY